MELTPLKDPIGLTPTNRKYADGKVYRVWREKGGKVRRRLYGVRNYTDKSAPKGSDRMPGFVNTTDRPPGTKGKVSHKRKAKGGMLADLI